jgi:predicted branched-subunit amino acid permease
LSSPYAWREAGTLTLPVMFGYLPLGAAFGILAIELGIPAWAALLMSLAIYAGAGQFLAVALLAAGAGLVEVTVASLAVVTLHLWRRNALLSIIGGTAAYMAMVQLGWSP